MSNTPLTRDQALLAMQHSGKKAFSPINVVWSLKLDSWELARSMCLAASKAGLLIRLRNGSYKLSKP